MSVKKTVIAIIVICELFLVSCVYIVLPGGLVPSGESDSKGWTAVATGIETTSAGDLHIDLTIRNETGNWSTMKAVDGSPAVLTSGGKTTNCSSVFAGTGGHRLAPGFQMRGYLTGKKADPVLQQLYIECKGGEITPGAKLVFNYVAFDGDMDYYHQENGKSEGKIEINLDEIASDLSYPIYEPVDGMIQSIDTPITAISENIITLNDVQRTDKGLQFTWQNYNPTEFALTTHIGTPPVIGSDGIIYGIFEIMDLASVPLTPAGGAAEWTTEAAVPADVGGFYILLSVESKQMRLYVSHAVDISDL